MGLVIDNKGCGEAYHLSELVETHTIVNCLPRFGPKNVLVFMKPKSQILFSNGTSYIDPFIDVKYLDVLLNNITKNTMGRK
jgi:hypothetical protein